jgi:hypothetical protein
MKKYFTSLDLEGDKFVGSLHDPETNQVIYKTKAYNSQSQVTSEINEYLTKINPITNKIEPTRGTIVNTAIYKTVRTNATRCCGN